MALSIYPEFLSYRALQSALSGQESLKTLQHAAKTLSMPASYGSTWQVVFLHVRSFFSPILKNIFKVFSEALEKQGHVKSALKARILSVHFGQDTQLLKAYTLFKERFLHPSKNVHDMRTENLWGRPAIQHTEITDSEIRKYLPQIIETKLSLASPFGVCRGSTDWFLHLYVKSRTFFSHPETQLIAIAKLFENGAPKEATLLQSLPGLSLGFTKPVRGEQFNFDYFIAEETSRAEPRLDQYPPGAYSLFLTFHALGYIKINPLLGYVFDPSYGLIKLEGQQSAALLTCIFKLHGKQAFHLENFDKNNLQQTRQKVS